MLFNSIEFIILFLPIVFFLYWFVFNKKLLHQNILILVASYFFYAWWDWRFMLLLLLSTFIDYAFGLVIDQSQRHKKLYLWLSIVNNLAILCFFKYYNFFAESTRDALSSFGFHVSPYILEIALPVGISFYTFHGMSYVFVIYREKIKPIKNFADYAVFVSFFPLLVAGPIERATHLLPQVQKTRTFDYTQAVQGLRLMLWGFFKKIVIADTLAVTVDKVFANYTDYSGSTLLLISIYFAIQIYCDFSGYTDIALGTAKLFGFELLSNFKFPYFSRNIAEFWRRWHVSLSSWFRDYLYIPLGGSKGGKLKAVRNTFIIFLVSGFWHGANWTFILWGGVHAMFFIPLLILDKNRKFTSEVVAANKLLPTAKESMQMFTTFAMVTFAWIFFRSPEIGFSFDYISTMVSDLFAKPAHLNQLFYVILFILMDWVQRENEREVLRIQNGLARNCFYFFLAIMIIFHFSFIENAQFIYFQF